MNLHLVLLFFVTLVWGTTFPLLKAAAAHLSGVEISALRFIVAALCLWPFALKASRAAWRDGVWLGAMGMTSYVTQAFGLQFISSNRSAFLTALNVLFVPLLVWLMGGGLSVQVLAAACLALGGIGLMSWEGGSHLLGDIATLACALTYAAYVLMLAKMVHKHSARELAATQITTMAVLGVLGLGLSGIADTTALASLAQRAQAVWPTIVYLGAIATAGMLFLQAIGQSRVSAARATLIFALEPAFAALFAWGMLSEHLSQRAALGGGLVIVAVVLSEWKFTPRLTPDYE